MKRAVKDTLLDGLEVIAADVAKILGLPSELLTFRGPIAGNCASEQQMGR